MRSRSKRAKLREAMRRFLWLDFSPRFVPLMFRTRQAWARMPRHKALMNPRSAPDRCSPEESSVVASPVNELALAHVGEFHVGSEDGGLYWDAHGYSFAGTLLPHRGDEDPEWPWRGLRGGDPAWPWRAARRRHWQTGKMVLEERSRMNQKTCGRHGGHGAVSYMEVLGGHGEQPVGYTWERWALGEHRP